ncbi:DUF262 domain-containing protein [Butyrivibrio sp. NC2007]|jgi:hypothetical protein|uniref:DUF262 domain-containing protein n=1 Tax=Butyrivibrio sp. NC2007 TaxID=1280683 RepID=UPI0003B47FF8|nr:DUF262 domain-containing protein [Butyrivibrio sp. NC2007]
MSNEYEHLQIVTLKTILGEKLDIPEYQRPYRWTTESAVTLFSDIYNAFVSKVPEYRIGSVVLHNNEGKMKIVDGQQRLTTLSILVYCFSEIKKDKALASLPELLKAEFNDLSLEAIVNNHQILLRKVKEMEESELDKYLAYLLDRCTMVRIVTDSEQEAFQFFDSQNSRGKALAPHDLLKSYHLREMRDDDETEKISIIERWETTNQKKLEHLFKDHLYPMVRWYKFQDGIGYSAKDIKTFKGIKTSNNFNFSIYNRAANLYVEHFNREGMYELASGKMINQFQLTQPVIAGKRFFEYSLHYLKLKETVEQLVEFKYKATNVDGLIPESGVGDSYIKKLFINIVMFYVDKFNIEALSDTRLEQMYKWAYSLRVVMKAVYWESVNRYAQGINDRVNYGVNLFARISEMQDPSEMDAIILESVDMADAETYKVNVDRYKNIIDRINS